MKLSYKQIEYISDTVGVVLRDVEINVNTHSNKVNPLLNDLESRLLQVIFAWESENNSDGD